jgi:predicted anti-sigma-YlaC factor YlaD
MSERLDGVLDSVRLEQLEQHLVHCSDCRQEWKELRASWEMLGQLPELEPGPLFQARVWEKIRLEPLSRPALGQRWRAWFAGLAFAAAALVWGVSGLTRTPAGPLEVAPVAQVASELGPSWSSPYEVIPLVDALDEEDPLEESVLLGQLSDDYLACSQLALDETLEGN